MEYRLDVMRNIGEKKHLGNEGEKSNSSPGGVWVHKGVGEKEE